MPIVEQSHLDQRFIGFSRPEQGSAYQQQQNCNSDLLGARNSDHVLLRDLDFVTSLYSKGTLASLPLPKSLLTSKGSLLSSLLLAKVAELERLPKGWDSRGTARAPLPVSLFACVTACQRLAEWSLQSWQSSFQEPFLAPNFDGCVQMEWNSPERALEIEAGEDRWLIAGAVKPRVGDPEFFEGEALLQEDSAVTLCYQWFKGLRGGWPL